MWKSTEFSVTPGFFLALGAGALMGAGGVLPVLLAAAVCHEAAHLLMLRLFRIPVEAVRLTASGAEIRAPIQTRLSYGREMAAVAAGPLCNLLLAVAAARLAGWYLLAGASFLLGAFNLLPVASLDGGRLLYLLIAWRRDPFLADRICAVVSAVCAWALTLALAALLLFTGQGVLLLAGAAGLLLPLRRILRRPGRRRVRRAIGHAG